MARSFAQLAVVVFLVVGVVGLFAGQPAHHVHIGGPLGADRYVGGWADFDGVALHLTYVRDVLDLAIAAAFAYAGWRAPKREAALTVLATGSFLLALAVIGFIVGDDDVLASGHHPSLAAMHFPLAINVFDLIAGVLGVLCGLGGLEEEPAPA